MIFEDLPTTRAEAIAAGASRYFTGVACKRGHLAPRLVSSGKCVECNAENGRAYWEANTGALREKKRAYRKANLEKITGYQRAYQKANREKLKEQNRARRKANWEKLKEQRRAYQKANKGRLNEYQRARRKTLLGRAQSLVGGARRNSKNKNLPDCTLDVEDITARLSRGVCEATGLPFCLDAEGVRGPYSPSLDRVNPALGYTPENVMVVVWAWNAMRGNWGTDVVLTVAAAALKHNPISFLE